MRTAEDRFTHGLRDPQPREGLSTQRPFLSAAEARAMIAAEVLSACDAEVRPDAVVVFGGPKEWRAALRSDGNRLDEAVCAAVSEIARRFAAGYDLAWDDEHG